MNTEIGFGVITTDNDLKIFSWNQWIENVIGKKLIKGEKLTKIFPEIVERNLESKLLETLQTNSISILSSKFHKYLIKCKPIYPSSKFQEMQQSVTISPLHDGTKRIGLIIVIKDVTHELENSQEKASELFINLSDKDWTKRKEAVEEISKNHHSLINDIVLRIKNEHKNFNILNSALQVLINTPAEVIDVLIDLLNSDDPDLRIYAAQTMGEKNNPRIIEALIKALNDDNQNVRYHSVESLGKLKAKIATDKLLELAFAQDFFISFPAIDALKNIGDKSIAIKLLPLLENEIFANVVVETLGKIGDEKVIIKLCDVINKNKNLTITVCNSLIDIYNKYQNTYQEGELISTLIQNNINSNGILNIIHSIPKASDDNKSLIPISKVLSWLKGEEVEKTLASLIHNDKVRDLILDSLIKLGNKIAPLLHSQIQFADSQTKCAIITVLGRIGDKESVPLLIDSLDEYDEKICVTALGSLAKIGDRRAFKPIINLLGNENPSIRRAAISALNSIGHPEMENVVFELLSNSNPIIRDSAIRIAGYFGYPKTKELIIKSCNDENENVRIAAIENLPFFEDYRTIEIIKNILKNKSTKCKIAAVKALAHFEDENAKDLLVQYLNEKDPWIKINAMRSLAFHRFFKAEYKIIDIAMNDTSIPVKITAIETLGEIGSIESVSVLSKFIDNDNIDISKAAIKSLGKLKIEESKTPLLQVLKFYDEEKKLTAIEALSNKSDNDIIETLSWVALTDSSCNIKVKAIESISNIGNQKSIEELIKLSSEKSLRELSIKSLAQQNHKNIFLIAKGLESNNSKIKTAIIEALSRMKISQASEIICTCLDDEDPEIRTFTINILDRIGNRNQEKKIADLALQDPNEMVRAAANEYLRIN